MIGAFGNEQDHYPKGGSVVSPVDGKDDNENTLEGDGWGDK
jgi:hypothetical protein